MKKAIRLFAIAILLVMLLIGCTTEAFANADSKIKYTQELLDVVDTADNNSIICVAVYLNLNESENKYQEDRIGVVNEKYVSFEDFVRRSDEKDLRAAYFEWRRDCLKIDVPIVFHNKQLGTQYYNYYDYESYYDNFINTHDLFSCFPKFKEFTDAPCLYLKVSQEKLKEITSDESVVFIDLEEADNTLLDSGVYRYFDSSDALRILRESVSSIKKHFGPNYDVNDNGIVDSSDALVALRVSAGFIEDAPYFDKWETFTLYDRTRYNDPKTDIIHP